MRSGLCCRVLVSRLEEKKLLGALIAISTGVSDVSRLNVPVEVGSRLLQCYDDVGKEE